MSQWRFETPDARLRRFSQTLISSQAKSENLRNQASELRLKAQERTHARLEDEAARRRLTSAPLVDRNRAENVARQVQRFQETGEVSPVYYSSFPEYKQAIDQARGQAVPVTPATISERPAIQGQPVPISPQERAAVAPAQLTTPLQATLGEAEQLSRQQSALSRVTPTLQQLTTGPRFVPGFERGIERIRGVPYAGPTLATGAEFATSPAGIATGVALPGATAVGLGGQTVLGSLGGVAEEELGAPKGTRTAAELIGGLAGPAELAGAGRMLSVAERRTAQNLAIRTERAGGVRPLLGEEAGGTRVPPRDLPEESYAASRRGIERLYHETTPDRAVDIATGDMNKEGMFVAARPELALGQGANRGAIVEFTNTNLIGVQPARGKAGARLFESVEGQPAEFIIGRSEDRGDRVVQSITFKPENAPRRAYQLRLRNLGWQRENLPDGSVQFTNPRINEPIVPRAGGRGALLAEEVGGTRIPRELTRLSDGELVDLRNAPDATPETKALISAELAARGMAVPPEERAVAEQFQESLREKYGEPSRTETGGIRSGPEPIPPPPRSPEPPLGGFGDEIPPETPDLPPIEGPERQRFARPSQLKTVQEVSDDARVQSQNYLGGLGRMTGKVPGVRGIVHALNPSALIDEPPPALVESLGREQAANLQGALYSHGRKLENAGSLVASVEHDVAQTARRIGLRVQDGMLTNDKGLSAPVGDVFERPLNYAPQLSARQREFIDDVRALLDDMHAAEKAAGVKKGEVFSEEGRYFPRQVTEVRGTENLRSQIRSLVGAKQGFQRERFYETMLEGIENGVRYESDMAALIGTRLRAGLRAVTDAELGKIVKPYGRTLKKPRTAQVGELGTMIPEFGGRAFDRDVALQIMNTLQPQAPRLGGPFGVANVINGILTPIRATGDLSFTLIQNLNQLYRNPVAFLKSFGYGLDSLAFDGRFYGRYLESNTPFAERYVAGGGVFNGSEVTFAEAARSNKFLNALKPATNRFDNAFQNAGNVAALENFKAIVGIGDNVGQNRLKEIARRAFGPIGETTDEVAATIASKMVGRLSTRGLGVGATQREVERLLAFAPRFYRAVFGLMGDAVQGGLRGNEARRTLLGLGAGALTTYTGLAWAMGQKPKLDPMRSDFMTVRIKGQNVGFGGPMYGLIRAVAESIQNPEKLDEFNMDNPALRWARGRASPVLGIALDLASKRTYLGEPLRTPQQIAQHLATSSLPFGAQALIREGPLAAVASGLGGRSFPTPSYQQRDEVAQELTGKNYNALDVDERQRVDADQRVQSLSAQIDREGLERGQPFAQAEAQIAEQISPLRQQQELDDAAASSGEMDIEQWKDNQRIRGAQQAVVKDAIFSTLGVAFKDKENLPPIKAALDDYFAIETGAYTDLKTREVDWGSFFNDRDAALEMLSPEQKTAAIAEIEKNLTPFQQQFREASRVRGTLAPRFSGISEEQEKQLQDLDREAERVRDELADKGVPADAVPGGQIYDLAAGRLELPEQFAAVGYSLRPGTKLRERLTNPAYIKGLVDNRKVLEEFYPNLYSRDLKRALVGAGR